MKKEIKGMILAIEDGYATVLTPDGQFLKHKLSKESCYIGDEITFETALNLDLATRNEWFRQTFRRPILRTAFSLGVVLTSAITSWAYPTGHVYMDVNPSIGISYNVYHRVIGVQSFNADGETVLDSVSLYGKSIEESVETSLIAMNDKGFVKDETSGVILGFSQDSASVKESVVEAVSTVVEKVEKTIEVSSVKVERTAAKQAVSVGSSPIKVAIVTAESKNGTNKKAESAMTEAELQTGVDILENQTTSEIIQSNPEILPPVQDSRLDKIKKTLKNKKDQLKKLQNKEQENLKLEILKKQEEIKRLNQLKKKNQNQSPNPKPNQNQTVSPPIEVNPQEPPIEVVPQEPLIEVLPLDTPIETETQDVETAPDPIIDENQSEADQIENVSGSSAAEKINALINRKQKLEATKLKILDARLKPEERRVKFEIIEKQLKQIDRLLEVIKNKPNKGVLKKGG